MPLPEALIAIKFLPTLNKHINRLIGQAMHTYDMLADGDRVLLAVSGGIDSLVLTWILDHWRNKAPIDYELLAVHIDMGFGGDEHQLVTDQLKQLHVPYLVEFANYGEIAAQREDKAKGCYECALLRRNRLFELARAKHCSKIAFGHHKEDIIETFFINLMYSGNLSTMVPKQVLFDGRLALIRPLAFLEKREIQTLGDELGIKPVANPCPLADASKRQYIREMLESLYQTDKKIKASIFAALSNIKNDYLLIPAGKSPEKTDADHT